MSDKYFLGFTEKTTEPLDSELIAGGTGAAPDYTFRWGNMVLWIKNKLFGSATVWTSDNDGVGSGLDADTLQNETPVTLRDRALHTGDAPALNININTSTLSHINPSDCQALAVVVDDLSGNQITGVEVFSTYALMIAQATPVVNASYKVSNDPTSSNNGYYHWTGSGYVKDASLNTGEIANGEVDAVEGGKIYDSIVEQNFDISFSGANDLTVDFSKSGTTVSITFPSIGTMYAIGRDGVQFASTTAHLSQTYVLGSFNQVLVWNIDSNTVSVETFSTTRDFRNIVLLRKAYHLVTGGYYAPQYWDCQLNRNIYLDYTIAISGTDHDGKPDFNNTGSVIATTFPSSGEFYLTGRDGIKIKGITSQQGQTYNLSNSLNSVLVFNVDSGTINAQLLADSRDENNIVLLHNNFGRITGGYYAPQYWDWEEKIYTSNVEFMSREGRVNGYPGNSYASAYECKRVQIDHIRVSVRKTLDNFIVLSHDDAINSEARETNGDPIVGTVNISANNLATLNTYDYGIKYGAQFAGLAIAELEPMIDTCAKMGMALTLELKYNPAALEVESICKLLSKYSMVNSSWISTNHEPTLVLFNAELTRINIAFIAHITTGAITAATNYQTGDNDVRLDIFDADTVTEALYYQAVQDGIEIKVGSVYVDSNIPLWYNKGVRVIEVADIPYPDKWLNGYDI